MPGTGEQQGTPAGFRNSLVRWDVGMLAAGSLLLGLAGLDWLGIGVLWPLRFPVFALTLLVLLAVSWSLARRFDDLADESDLLILDTALIALSLAVMIGLALGTVGVLGFRGLVAASGVLAFTSLFPYPDSVCRDAPPGRLYGSGQEETGGEGVPNSEEARAALTPSVPLSHQVGEGEGSAYNETSVRAPLSRNRGRGAGGEGSPGGEGLMAFALIGLAIFAFVQGVGGRILRPPIGDPIAYHLPFAVEWLQFGDLSMPAAPAGDPSPPFYPLNSSLWMFWSLTPFESEVLARFVQAPFLILLFIAVWRLAIEVRLGKLGAIVAGTLAVTVPGIARSTSTPENDLILAALLLTATAYLAALWREPTGWRALLTALVFGLAAGTKVTALPYVGLLGIVWAALIVLDARRGRLGRPIPLVLGGLTLVLLLGGYSYLRNLIVMGNPLYPAGYEILGRHVLDGLFTVTREWRVTHAFYPFDWSGFFLDIRRVFGISVTFWALPGLVLAGAVGIWTVLRARMRVESMDRAEWVAVAVLLWTVVAVGIFWFVIPYHWERFLYPAVVWGIIAAAWAVHRTLAAIIPRYAELGLALVSLPVIFVGLLNTPLDPAIRERPVYWLAFAGCVGVALLVGLVVFYAPNRVGVAVFGDHPGRGARPCALGDASRRLYRWSIPVLLLGIVAASALWPVYEETYRDRRIDEWRLRIQSFNQLPDAWEWIEQETRDDPAEIAVAGTNEILPLYGRELDNRLHTIWHSGEDVRYGWGDPYRHFGEPDRDVWLAQVETQEIDLIYMTENVSFGGWPVEREWIESMPGRFEIVFENQDVIIWRVLQSAE